MPLAWIDVASLTGLPERQLPRSMREPGDTRCDVQSFIALCGNDPSMDPRSNEVLAGSAGRFAEFYGRSLRQTRRVLERPDADFIYRLPGGLLAMVISSGAFHRDTMLKEARSSVRRDAALARWRDQKLTDVTPGWSSTAAPEAKFQP